MSNVNFPDLPSEVIEIEKSEGDLTPVEEKTTGLFEWAQSFFETETKPEPLEEGRVKKEDLDRNTPIEALCGIVGNGEMFRKVRVTWINGIDHTSEDAIRLAKCISKAFGDVNVHYVCNETAGFWNDLAQAGMQKIAGRVTPEVKALAIHFKKLIHDLGGVDSGGKIIHLAHSQGAIITYLAKAYLTSAELKMIDVITFGAAQVITSDSYNTALNYISEKDPLLFINRAALAVWRSGKPTNEIICLEPIDAEGYIDHSMDGPTYKSALRLVAQSFKDDYETYAAKALRWTKEKWHSYWGSDSEIPE